MSTKPQASASKSDSIIRYTQIAAVIFAVMTVVFDVFAYKIAQYVCYFLLGKFANGYVAVTTGAFFVASIFIFAILYALYKLLNAIRRGELFVDSNLKLINIAEFGCVGLTLLFALMYVVGEGFILLAAIAAFMSLIISCVKIMIQRATELKEENDLTV